METEISAIGKKWSVEKLLGKGKSGYSYLVKSGDNLAVWKKIHHEPVSYYTFSNKLLSEVNAYHKLKSVGVEVPELLEVNEKDEWLLKEFIPEPTLAELVAKGYLENQIWVSIFNLAADLQKNGLNVDYFPTNFVWHTNRLYYVDYEWNPYFEEWDFTHWGIWYWVNQEGMKTFLETGNHLAINKDDHSGKPLTLGLENRVSEILSIFQTTNL